MSVWAPPGVLLRTAEDLLSQPTYRRRSFEDQLQILFLVLQLQIRASLAKESVPRDLYLNTARQFTSGDSRLRIDRRVVLANWAGESTAINPGVVFDVAKPLLPGDAQFALLSQSIGALAHEVSHALSRPTVAGRISYLIEEYRAYQVGFVAEHQRWPSKAQSAASLLDVLFNPWRIEGYEMLAKTFLNRWKTEPYRQLFETLSLDVEKVAAELSSFRSPEFVGRRKSLSADEIAEMRTIIHARLISVDSNFEPAPKIGWDGYERNEKKRRRRKE
jgi:hypothetical protein